MLVAVVQVLTRASEFSLSKPARETIYTRVDREAREAQGSTGAERDRPDDLVVGAGAEVGAEDAHDASAEEEQPEDPQGDARPERPVGGVDRREEQPGDVDDAGSLYLPGGVILGQKRAARQACLFQIPAQMLAGDLDPQIRAVEGQHVLVMARHQLSQRRALRHLWCGRAVQRVGDLGQTPEACVTLAEVAVQYPGSVAATQAPIAMQALGCS